MCVVMRRILIVTVFVCAVFSFASADFRTDALKEHNKYRAEHHAPPLALSDKINKSAQQWAQEMADSGKFKHSGVKYGENNYMSTDTKMTDSEAAIDATKQWYNEKSKYKYTSARFTKSTGHFTQVVWSGSKYLGIGVARSKKGVYVCAQYDPPGNAKNRFIQNVLAP